MLYYITLYYIEGRSSSRMGPEGPTARAGARRTALEGHATVLGHFLNRSAGSSSRQIDQAVLGPTPQLNGIISVFLCYCTSMINDIVITVGELACIVCLL